MMTGVAHSEQNFMIGVNVGNQDQSVTSDVIPHRLADVRE
jgi:hypothetical protein